MRSLKSMKVVRTLGIMVLAMSIAGSAAAQSFTGGLRGAVRDANGVIPGVTVQIVNEATNQTREAISNEQGEYNFAAVPPGTYTVKASSHGLPNLREQGGPYRRPAVHHHGHSTGGRPAPGNHHGDGTVALDRYVQRVDRRSDRFTAARDVAERRPLRVLVRRDGADGRGFGRRAVQSSAGPDQRIAAVARGRDAARQQLPD